MAKAVKTLDHFGSLYCHCGYL